MKSTELLPPERNPSAQGLGPRKFVRKPKQPRNIAMECFPDQFKRLRPENGVAGGIKARSASEEVRMGIYNAIAKLFKEATPYCQACDLIFARPAEPTRDVHHKQGRDGLLLLDARKFVACCRECHDWIQSHPDEARKLKLLPA